MVSWQQLDRRTCCRDAVGKKEEANEAVAQFMALSKPRVYRFHRHSSARFRVWQRLTDTDDRQKQQLNRGGTFCVSFYVSVVEQYHFHSF